jgi:cytochrome c553
MASSFAEIFKRTGRRPRTFNHGTAGEPQFAAGTSLVTARLAPGRHCRCECSYRAPVHMWRRYMTKCSFGFAISILAALTITAAAQDIEAQVQSCAACQGQNGAPADPKTTPIIWGQTEYYLVRQLQSYKKGDRHNPAMEAISKSIKDEDMRPIGSLLCGKSVAGKPSQKCIRCRA